MRSGPGDRKPTPSRTRYVGGTADFLVHATGKRPLTYEWQHGGAPLPNSDTNHLIVTN